MVTITILTFVVAFVYYYVKQKQQLLSESAKPELEAEIMKELGLDEPEYFTYEAPQHVSSAVKQRRPQAAAAPAPKAVEEPYSLNNENESVAFDLHQAVIAQTILHNDYLDDRY